MENPPRYPDEFLQFTSTRLFKAPSGPVKFDDLPSQEKVVLYEMWTRHRNPGWLAANPFNPLKLPRAL